MVMLQVDMEMERRALEEGGYDSDLDREEAIMQELDPREPEEKPDENLVSAALIGLIKLQLPFCHCAESPNAPLPFHSSARNPSNLETAEHLDGLLPQEVWP